MCPVFSSTTPPSLSGRADIGQHTTPAELPIVGDPFTEIALELVFPKGNPQFLLNGKRLQLLQPLDRDEDNISHIVFQVRAKFVYACVCVFAQKNASDYIAVRCRGIINKYVGPAADADAAARRSDGAFDARSSA